MAHCTDGASGDGELAWSVVSLRFSRHLVPTANFVGQLLLSTSAIIRFLRNCEVMWNFGAR